MASIEIKAAASTGGGGGGGTGTVTSVALSSGTTGSDINVSGSPITTFGTLVLNVPVASAVNTGKLSSTDWLSFNGKQAALVSGVNLRTVNGNTLLGSTDIAVQPTLVSGVNLRTVNGNTLLGSTDLVISSAPGGTDGQVQYNNGGAFGGGNNFIWNDTTERLAIGKPIPQTKLEVFEPLDNVLALFENDVTGAGISFVDATTGNITQVTVGAIGNLLFLRGGGNLTGTIQIDDDNADFQGNELRNFIPRSQTTAINLTIDATNSADLNGSVLEVTGALTVTIDGAVTNGFNISVIQMDANQTTFVGAGGVTLRNRQGHTKTFGQYSTVTLYVTGNDLILAGDTAP